MTTKKKKTNNMKRHGYVVAQLDNGDVVSGIVRNDGEMAFVNEDGKFEHAGQHAPYTILKDLRSKFYAGQECEFSDGGLAFRNNSYLIFDGEYHLDDNLVAWDYCKAIDPQSELKAEIEQKRKELAELEAKLKQEK